MKKKHTKLFEWQERIKAGGERCAYCESLSNLTVDHIIPVSILEPLYLDTPEGRYDMVYNDEANFQVLCKYCNHKKANQLDIRNLRTIPLLRRLINFLESKANKVCTLPSTTGK